MADVVLRFPIEPGAEAQAFGAYLTEFMARGARWADLLASQIDGPIMIIRADPAVGAEAKVLIFQEGRIAEAFDAGWRRRRSEAGVI